MSWIGSLIGDLNHTANSINPFKGPTDWLTNNTLAKLPVVGKPLGQLADWGDSHPAQVGAAIGAAFGGAAVLGGAGAGGAAGGAAGGGDAAGGGLGGLLGSGSETSIGGDGLLSGSGLGSGTESLGGGTDWTSLLTNQLSNSAKSGSSGGSAGAPPSQSSSPDYFASLFTFGPGSVTTQPASQDNYSAMLLNGLG